MAEANRRQAVDQKLYQRKTEYEADVDYGAEISKITEPIGLEIANREAQKDKIQSDYEAVEEQLQTFEFDQESDNSALVLDLVNKAKAAKRAAWNAAAPARRAALERIIKSGQPRQAPSNSANQNSTLNGAHLTGQTGVVGGSMCKYSDGSVVKISGSYCPRRN